MTRKEKTAIREFYGHNGVECRVRIRANGDIERHGSPDPFNRQYDFWVVVSTVAMERAFGVLKTASEEANK